jgi:hypothetical protein
VTDPEIEEIWLLVPSKTVVEIGCSPWTEAEILNGLSKRAKIITSANIVGVKPISLSAWAGCAQNQLVE